MEGPILVTQSITSDHRNDGQVANEILFETFIFIRLEVRIMHHVDMPV